ncbi:helix-turn-helix domain-containing protein [Weissella cibaria]|mgnify:CR=1 FL=1|uniref:helix-turn-helix domain-containing protein n=1 Tax=Weissella cibaria TaxID=137591 RepID=UPI000D0BAC9B|nr:helix-turn-helix transcriptional regulator [Weissella cibaria]AVO66267.1 XRE family transcriptional regulator [Weissella cibaria]MBU7545354.1 helix-turn-helix transcriptional regulator [Weissella cibaria]MCV3317061.1 helix-turn-helix domain-containing protein [Weissella cibaria]UOX36264.1 helix-turn-helix transcriptional regulator [Weissella cibaria]
MTTFERIKEISKQRGLNLKKTATEAGLSENAIYKWKTQTPQSNALQAVADVLGVSVDYLLGNTDEMHSNKKDDKKIADLKDIMKEFEIVQFDGKTIPEEDLLVIERIIKGLIDDQY